MTKFPDAAKAAAALDKLPFLVVQDMFLTETAKLADVVVAILLVYGKGRLLH